MHSVNHLLLPTVQSWLRKGNNQLGYWDAAAIANFKHCTGLCADLVVEYIVAFTSKYECIMAMLRKRCGWDLKT